MLAPHRRLKRYLAQLPRLSTVRNYANADWGADPSISSGLPSSPVVDPTLQVAEDVMTHDDQGPAQPVDPSQDPLSALSAAMSNAAPFETATTDVVSRGGTKGSDDNHVPGDQPEAPSAIIPDDPPAQQAATQPFDDPMVVDHTTPSAAVAPETPSAAVAPEIAFHEAPTTSPAPSATTPRKPAPRPKAKPDKGKEVLRPVEKTSEPASQPGEQPTFLHPGRVGIVPYVNIPVYGAPAPTNPELYHISVRVVPCSFGKKNVGSDHHPARSRIWLPHMRRPRDGLSSLPR